MNTKVVYRAFLNRLIIYYITRVPLQKGLTFVVVVWGYKNWNSNTHVLCTSKGCETRIRPHSMTQLTVIHQDSSFNQKKLAYAKKRTNCVNRGRMTQVWKPWLNWIAQVWIFLSLSLSLSLSLFFIFYLFF